MTKHVRPDMKKFYLIVACLCLCAFAILPAQAFTANSLTITVAENGDAHADMQYSLSFIEQAAVFAHIADPSAQLEGALRNNFNKPVTVIHADSSSADVIVLSFATIAASPGQTTMTTPSLSFARAQDVVKQYWFAPLISADFSPTVTTIIFPDGYRVTYNDLLTIPSTSHQIA